MAYLTGANAGATVRVKRPVSGVSIRTGQFHQLLKEEPRVGALLMSFLARTLAHPFGGSQSACISEGMLTATTWTSRVPRLRKSMRRFRRSLPQST